MKRTLLCLMVLVAAVVCSTAVTLEWDRNSEPVVTGYRIYAGTNSRVYHIMVDVGDTNVCALTNLTRGLTYYFAATAYTGDGLESDFSEEVSYTVPKPRPLPPARLRLEGTNQPPRLHVPIEVGTDFGIWKQIGSIELYGTNVSQFLRLGP